MQIKFPHSQALLLWEPRTRLAHVLCLQNQNFYKKERKKYSIPQSHLLKFLISIISIFLIYIILLTSFRCHAVDLSDDQVLEIYHDLSAKWQAVNYVPPQGFEFIYSTQHPLLWPALPESYEWRILPNDVLYLFKHLSAMEHDFDFVTYPTDDPTHFNFLSCWDGITHHSFSYTRNPPLHNEYARSAFPINAEAYRYGSLYTRGHCIDFADTQGINNSQMFASNTVDYTISTFDPRNYIPEPPRTHWGISLRKELVRTIREQKGCYAQYMYYPFVPARTKNGTAIPEGIYFVKPAHNQSPLISYHVSWGDPIHNERAYGDSWQYRLQRLQDPHNFLPSPYVHDQRNPILQMDFGELPLTYLYRGGFMSYMEYYKITKAADHEVRNIMGKISLTHYLLQQNYEPAKIESWLIRLVNHATLMENMDNYNFMSESAGNELARSLKEAKAVDEDDRLYDHLNQICKNQAEEVLYKDITKRNARKVPLEVQVSIPQQVFLIDMNDYKKSGKAIDFVIKHLEKINKKIRIINLTTPRAALIAESIKAKFGSNLNELKQISVEYNVSPTKKWNVQPEFSNRGINAKRISF